MSVIVFEVKGYGFLDFTISEGHHSFHLKGHAT